MNGRHAFLTHSSYKPPKNIFIQHVYCYSLFRQNTLLPTLQVKPPKNIFIQHVYCYSLFRHNTFLPTLQVKPPDLLLTLQVKSLTLQIIPTKLQKPLTLQVTFTHSSGE